MGKSGWKLWRQKMPDPSPAETGQGKAIIRRHARPVWLPSTPSTREIPKKGPLIVFPYFLHPNSIGKRKKKNCSVYISTVLVSISQYELGFFWGFTWQIGDRESQSPGHVSSVSIVDCFVKERSSSKRTARWSMQVPLRSLPLWFYERKMDMFSVCSFFLCCFRV